MDETGYVDGSERYPEKDGYTFLGWEDKDGNLVESRTPITEDCTFTARYISDSELTHGVDIAFGKNIDVIRYSPFFKVYQINYEVLPVDAQDKKVQWSSSDERIATVDDDGRVLFNDTGKAPGTTRIRVEIDCYNEESQEYISAEKYCTVTVIEKPAPGWSQIDGKWYYYDQDGNAVTGLQKITDTWYYFDNNGVMQTGWVSDGGKWYYMNSSGAMVTGWQTVNGTWYYFKSGGDMAAGEWCGGYWLNANGSWTYQPKGSWKKNNQGWWFGDTSGWFAKNTTQRIDNVWYRFDAAGYWK